MILYFYDYKDELFKAVKEIRYKVFLCEQLAFAEGYFDEADTREDTLFALKINEERIPVATGRMIKEGNSYKIGRIAVLESERGKGSGKKIVEGFCRSAKDKGATEIFVNAQLHAIPFYEKLGFELTGEDVNFEMELPHRPMRKVLV
ncbi:MAG: GNAT family N-acetyltransferase [Eubacterium sp.]|nr:GNAT family N-acetyltransferase [Eubacterium sp.]